MSMGILCLFVNQSLFGYKRIICSKDETGNMVGLVHAFSWLAIFCFAFFGMVVFSSALMEELGSGKIAYIKHTLDIIILIGSLLPISLSLVAQRTFKLRAVL